MSLTLESSRFGTVDIADEAIVQFPSGLIGLGGRRFALVAKESDSAFAWLHSLEDPELALPVTNPFHFFPGYEVVLSDAEAARIGIADPEACDVWVTVRAAETLAGFTANLRAPVLVAGGRGFQVINEAEDAPVQALMFPDHSADEEPEVEGAAAAA
jgi:flagellar assembly factor FliW